MPRPFHPQLPAAGWGVTLDSMDATSELDLLGKTPGRQVEGAVLAVCRRCLGGATARCLACWGGLFRL